MRLRFTRRAITQLEAIAEYISTDCPRAAEHVASRIHRSISYLIDQPHLGPAGPYPGTR